MPIFDESTLTKLEQLTLVADRVRVGVMKGDRRSRKRGSSVEFADYRDYSKGDDLRRLDWNVYARLERPFIKLLEEEEDLAVHILLDASASMDWPEDTEAESNKLGYGLRLAGALGHIGLSTNDLVQITLLNSQGDRTWGPFRGRRNSLHLLQFLETAAASGPTDLNISLRNYALRARRPGLLFLISDFLSPGGWREGLNALQSRGYEIGLIHLFSPDEIDPPLGGDLKLVDIETGAEAEITLDPTTRDAYRARLQEWQAELAGYSAARRLHYIPVVTSSPWEKLILQTLRRQGLVK
jgi:uncharacterized protein (DUF58 family)